MSKIYIDSKYLENNIFLVQRLKNDEQKKKKGHLHFVDMIFWWLSFFCLSLLVEAIAWYSCRGTQFKRSARPRYLRNQYKRSENSHWNIPDSPMDQYMTVYELYKLKTFSFFAHYYFRHSKFPFLIIN